MNAVLGMARLLLDADLQPEHRSWVQIIHKSGEGLLSLINDILDYSKIEAGRLSLENVDFDLQAALSEVIDIMYLNAQEKSLELLVDIESNVPATLVGDPGRFKQVLFNLIGNAIKFTATGHVLVRVAAKCDYTGNAVIFINIADTGIGIPSDKIQFIFEKFTQGEESTTRRFGGTGLGLTISRQLVNMMGGKLTVTSEFGRGATFSYDLHLHIGMASNEPHDVNNVDLSGLHVLIVDDYLPSNEILFKALTQSRLKVDKAVSSAEAGAKITAQSSVGKPYDFVVTDYKLGKETGLDLCRSIKNDSRYSDTPIVMISALGEFASLKTLKEAGVDGFLVKPFYPHHIEAMLKILHAARQRGEKLPVLTRHSLAKALRKGENSLTTNEVHDFGDLNILVTEDVPINRILLCKILDKLGNDPETAANGVEALDKVHEVFFDIIFMDCQMPEMDGFSATKEIRRIQKDSGHRTIIIALTADVMTGDREKCLDAGMDDYIGKPFKPEQIIEVLQRWGRR